MKSIGICVGASNINYVKLEKKHQNIAILEEKSIPHEGNPIQGIRNIFSNIQLEEINSIAVTGRKLRHILNASSLAEPEAVELAYDFCRDHVQDASVIVSAGGENFMVYELGKNGQIIDVYTGNKCASGTGEFFLQQLKRMNLSLEEANEKVDLKNPYKVAGRCSVFCKSDCTHALNKGTPKETVVAGLSEMMAGKIMELLKKVDYHKVLLIGGSSKNQGMVEFLRNKVPHLILPPYAQCFEALGAALWALKNETKPIQDIEELFGKAQSSFSFLSPLEDHTDYVHFKTLSKESAEEGDRCILGLDVGSTTTKAVLLRTHDDSLLASVYLRTNGDPIEAAKQCYRSLLEQTQCNVKIEGLGVTGSGRQIAGLHALTDGVINEIIAHATAAVYFDPEVDTIFEIGGQDAKYTYITNKVPSDYAMNEACSAGTGSFLEEVAKESLDIDTLDIADIAMKGMLPPNFSDQCSAFISSDIKTAIQENISVEDITAGLVYSICMNYVNRVKGSRSVGKKVFMQGGVCYNKAVPVAMASLIGKEIIVPPEPGLMGAFGVALEVKNKLQLGLLEKKEFDLKELAERTASYKSPFICPGGKEKCDRKCKIHRIEIEGKTYPFGGGCNKYVNLIKEKGEMDILSKDLVALREEMVFETFSRQKLKVTLPREAKRVGLNRSLLTNTLYPLYYNFFTSLGLEVVLVEGIDPDGIENKGASFCYPIEIAHGNLGYLLKEKLDYLFLPHVKGMFVENGIEACTTCPFVQGEPYYLKASFQEQLGIPVFSPILNFSQGYEQPKKQFSSLGEALGFSKDKVESAFAYGVQCQKEFYAACREIGQEVIAELEQNPEKIAIVLFGRPYNAFTKLANMGIPKKFASRGFTILPYDFLPLHTVEPIEQMYWAMGQLILKGAKWIEKHPQLFGTYITNFSCGPDSFIVSYFRDIMHTKPSLTLELDSHTADAGIETRIEAFLDVVHSYIEIQKQKIQTQDVSSYTPAKTVIQEGMLKIQDSKGVQHDLKDEGVHLLIPSMGDMGSRILASAFQYAGVHASAVSKPGDKELKIGRGNSSCKECLPLQLTIGSFIDYLDNRDNQEELLVYFMPETSGPCRFGQYNILMKNVIEKNRLEDVTLLSLTSENSYAGLGTNFILRAWHGVLIADILEEIYSAILVLAQDKEKALQTYEEVCDMVLQSVARDSYGNLKKTLKTAAQKLAELPKKYDVKYAKKVALVGEIYVRRDDFSRKNILEKMAEKEIIVKTSPIAEWIYYCDYVMVNNLSLPSSFKDRMKTILQGFFKSKFEKEIKQIFAKSGLYEYHLIDVKKIIESVSDLISPELTGEAILTTGTALTEVIDEVDGVISIGPFGCMPSRIAEALISQSINTKKQESTDHKALVQKVMELHPSIPFLSIESDGNVLPPIVEAKIESFCLQVERMHQAIQKAKEIQ